MVTTKVRSTREASAYAWPRWVSLILSIWLFISAFVWPSTLGEHTDTWILAILMFAASIIAMFVPPVRFANTVLSIWLFCATLAISHTQSATVWNDCIVAILVFVVSLIPSGVAHIRTHGGPSVPAVA
jgi:hypothetical protein